jgi:phospholipid/cholesterol/gamma-HCH transport system substrate-binding protein
MMTSMGLRAGWPLLAVALALGGCKPAGDEVRVYALLTNARGLADRTRVLSAGLQVGTVQSRVLDAASKKARVDIVVRGIKVYSNAVIAKQWASMLGEAFLDLDPGGLTDPRTGRPLAAVELKNGDQIMQVREVPEQGDQITELGAVLPQLEELLTQVKALTAGPVKGTATRVGEVTGESSKRLGDLLERVDQVAATVEGVARRRAGPIGVAVEDARALTESLRRLVGMGRREAAGKGRQVRTNLERLRQGIDEVETSLGRVQEMTAQAARGEGPVGGVLAEDSLVGKVEDATRGINEALTPITRLNTIVALGSEYASLEQSAKGYLHLELRFRPDKFYLIELTQQPRGVERRIEIREDSRRGGVQEADVVTSTSALLRVSLQFGKCYGPFCGRMGFKESTGGAGIDLHLFDDLLTLSADAFDPVSRIYPRFQARALISLLPILRFMDLRLVAGIDDVFNAARDHQRPDWILGAQVRFNDADLKPLLLVGGRR